MTLNFLKNKAFDVALTTVLSTGCLVVVTQGLSHLDWATQATDRITKWRIARTMEKTPKNLQLVDYKDEAKESRYFHNPALESSIQRSLEFGLREGGLFVLGAPQDAGKSAHLQEIVPKFLMTNPQARVAEVKFSSNDISLSALRSKLGIPEKGELESFLPNHSLIIIDQLDLPTLDDKAKMFFTELATLSRNSRKFFVIVCVSNSAVYKSILDCNGKRKISPLCDPSLLQINEDTARELAALLKKRSLTQNESADDIFRSRCVGAVRQWALTGRASSSRVPWKHFQKVHDDFYNDDKSWLNQLLEWFCD